jgi:hypothetical protein
MSSIISAARFQRWTGQTSNVDKCERCQLPRSVHGPDWTCPAGLPRRVPDLLLAAGVVLVLTAIIVAAVQPSQHALLGDMFLVGVVLGLVGLTSEGRRS